MAPVSRPIDRSGMSNELKAIRIAYNIPEGEQPVRVINSFKVASASDPKRVKKFPFSKEQRAWKCPECNRFLSSKRSFNEHMNIHTQKRPFACEFCEYSAASQMTLRRHVLRNHTPAQDWGYRCPYCPQVYMEPASYQQHVGSKHTGRSCTYGCPYRLCPFSSKCFRHFREHIRKHDTSERFNGPTDRQPCTRSDQELIMYLVDDDIGTGYKGLSTSTTVIRRRVMTKPVKTVIYTNNLIHRGPPRLDEEDYYPDMEMRDFMKQPLSLVPRTSAPRAVSVEETEELIVDGEIMPADNGWIEQEIEISAPEPLALADGQHDFDLD